METYAIVVLQDRYSGVYSGGGWLAIPGATDRMDDGRTRIDLCLNADEGPSGSDVAGATFWWTLPPGSRSALRLMKRLKS